MVEGRGAEKMHTRRKEEETRNMIKEKKNSSTTC
jgi:hypothetical protein